VLFLAIASQDSSITSELLHMLRARQVFYVVHLDAFIECFGQLETAII
jgi:hypothetical protein